MVVSGLYHQITPPVYPVVELICWLRDAYDERRGTFTSAQGNKIFSLSTDIIRQALRFPTSAIYTSFNEMALTSQFTKLPWQ